MIPYWSSTFPSLASVDSVEATGLGLSIAREIVRAHGGELVYDTQIGRGTTFVLRLPRTPEQSEAVDPDGAVGGEFTTPSLVRG